MKPSTAEKLETASSENVLTISPFSWGESKHTITTLSPQGSSALPGQRKGSSRPGLAQPQPPAWGFLGRYILPKSGQER